MTLADELRFIIRVVHTGAFAVWLGGGLLYLLVGTAIRQRVSSEAWATVQDTFRKLAQPSFALLLGSGVYLVFDRLAAPRLGTAYVVVLGAKLTLIAGIVWVLRPRGPRQASRLARLGWLGPSQAALILGAGAGLLGVLMTLIYEAEVGSP